MFAVSWNKSVDKFEQDHRKGLLLLPDGQMPVMRKKPIHLKEYWVALQQSGNTRTTMAGHRSAARHLRDILRTTTLINSNTGTDTAEQGPEITIGASAVASVSGGRVIFPAAMMKPTNIVTSLSTEVGEDITVPSRVRERGPLSIGVAPVSGLPAAHVPPMQQSTCQGSSIGFSNTLSLLPNLSNPPLPISHAQRKVQPRRPQMCRECGHCLKLGFYGTMHSANQFQKGNNACPVLPEDRRTPDGKRKSRPYETVCDCEHCSVTTANKMP